MLVEKFQVEIVGFQAIDSKGRAKFLSDLRQEYIKLNKKKTPVATKAHNIEDIFESLKYDVPSANVMIRNTQPGFEITELDIKAYCIVGASRHSISFSTKFDKEVKAALCEYKIRKNSNSGVIIGSLTYNEMLECINIVINEIKACN